MPNCLEIDEKLVDGSFILFKIEYRVSKEYLQFDGANFNGSKIVFLHLEQIYFGI